MKRKVIRLTRLSLCIAGVLNALPMYAQESSSIENVEVISVKGIRQSITAALAVKQDASVISDAISAEDIGKLPDENVAETLQRITGIQIQRRNGEGSRVAVRGLVQNRIELDGVSLVNPIGRSYSGFDETVFPVLQFVPAELLSGVEVYKSASADQVSGSLGGTVNLTLLKPLSVGDKTSISLQGSYDDRTDAVDPRYGITWSKELIEGELGVLVSLSESARSVGEELFFTRTGWSGDTLSAPGDLRLQTLDEDRDRTGALFNVQWRPTSETEIYLNTFYASYDIERDRSWFSSADSGGSVIANYLDTPMVSSNDTILAGTFISQVQGNGEALENNSETTSIVLGFNHTIDNWLFEGKVSHGSAEQDDYQDFARVRQNGVTFFRDFGQDLPVLNVTDDFDANDPNLYDSASGLIGFSQVVNYENDETTATFDTTYYLENDFFTSIEAGIRWADQKASRYQERAGDAINGGGVWIVPTLGGLEGSVDQNLYRSVSLSDVYDGEASNVERFIAAVPGGLGSTKALLNYVQQNASTQGSGVFFAQPDGTYSTAEEMTSLYIKANFQTQWSDLPVSGGFGARWVDTSQESRFFFIDDTGATADTFNRDYSNFLPSANIKIELDSDLILRAAYSKVVAQPDSSALAGGVSLDVLAGAARGGNPNLDVAEADAYDLSLEWYISEFSALTGAIFRKDVSGFLSPNTERKALEGAVNANVGSPDFGTNNFLVTSTVAGGDSTINGLELAYQTVWESGFGVQSNYTYIDSDGVSTGGDELSLPLEGLSENSVNLVAFYEKYGYSVRFAYNWRDSYLVSRNFNGSQLFEESRGQLDFSASYDINESWRVSFDAINLNDERVDQYSNFEERKFRVENTGRRFFAGVRATF
ncbi:TonB-dependent receptor [Paraglaciecola polaris]|nr:TonB-dependent receptor [Paraglaciecola polaris]